MNIEIVPDQACPECGAFWGHPDPALDFPNRPKVDNHWKCYNPDCEVGYYCDGRVTEYRPSPEEEQRLRAEAEAWVATLSFVPVES